MDTAVDYTKFSVRGLLTIVALVYFQSDCGQSYSYGREQTIATFTGSDFLSYNLSDRGAAIVSQRETLRLNFKTTSGNALLFYTGDESSYMNVGLSEGVVYITLLMGDAELSQTVGNNVRFDDGTWHELIIERETRELTRDKGLCSIYAAIDGMYDVSRSFHGSVSELVSMVMYVGGATNVRDLPGSRATQNLFGCLKGVQFTADTVVLDVLNMAKMGPGLLTQHGQPLYDTCQQVQQIEPVTITDRENFILLPRLSDAQNNFLSLTFRTKLENALLIYAAGRDTDVIALEIHQGHLYVIIDQSGDVIRHQVGEAKVNDGGSQHVSIAFQEWGALVTLNSVPESVTISMKNMRRMTSYTYLTGLDYQSNSISVHPAVYSAINRAGFTGCLSDVKIDGVIQDLKTISHQQSVPLQASCQRSVLEPTEKAVTDDIVAKFAGSNHFSINPRSRMRTLSEDIKIQFRTRRSSGSLVSARSKDASNGLEIYLHNTRLVVKVALNSIEHTMDIAQALNDNKWHTIHYSRVKVKVQVVLDGNLMIDTDLPMTGTDDIWKLVIDVDEIKLAQPIGSGKSGGAGMDYSADLTINKVPYIGHMKGFVFNSVEYLTEAYRGRTSDMSFTCNFTESPIAPLNVVSIGSADTYASLVSPQSRTTFSIFLQFSTALESGLLAYSQGRTGDYMGLEVVDGAVQFVYSINGSRGMIRSHNNENLNDQQWHSVNAMRYHNGELYLIVDDVKYASTLNDQRVEWRLTNALFIAGARSMSRLPATIFSKDGFVGCLASLDVSGRRVDLMNGQIGDAKRITRGCLNNAAGDTCQASSCENGGVCYLTWPTTSCRCTMTSYTGPTCADEGTSYQFGTRDGGLIVYSYPEPHLDKLESRIAFGLITSRPEATLLHLTSSSTRDYLRVDIVGGSLVVQYNIGGGNHVIRDNDLTKLNDGKYHIVQLIRIGPNASISIDRKLVAVYQPDDILTMLNGVSRLSIGGQLSKRRSIQSAFTGIMSGLVVDNLHVLDLTKSNDETITIHGDATLTTLSKYDMMATDPGEPKVNKDHQDEIISPNAGSQPCPSGQEAVGSCTQEVEQDEMILPKITQKVTVRLTTRRTTERPTPPWSPVIGWRTQPDVGVLTSTSPIIIQPVDQHDLSTEQIELNEEESVTQATGTGAFDLEKNIPLIAGICGAAVITIVLIGVIICRLSKSHRAGEKTPPPPPDPKTKPRLPSPNLDDNLKNDVNGTRHTESPLIKPRLPADQRRSDGKEWYV